MANALAGLGARSLEIGVDYVKERHAFGVPIGSFQAVAHGLADAATAVDGGVLLAREAAWAAGAEADRASELAALAFGFNAESARQASYRSLHYHGGLRLHARVRHPALLPPGQGVAGPVRRAPTGLRPGRGSACRPGPGSADHGLPTGRPQRRLPGRGPATSSTRCSPTRCGTEMHRTGVHHNWDFHRALVERGWLAPGWPVEYGGQGRDPMEMLAFAEEFQRAGAPTYGVGTTLMVANIIRHLGTDEQKRSILPPALRGEIIIVLGFTEPESRLRRGRRPDPGRPGRGRVGHQRPEDVHHQRPGGRLRLHAHPDQPRRGQAPGPDHLPGPAAPAGRRDPVRSTRCRASGPTSPSTPTSGWTTACASARSTAGGT